MRILILDDQPCLAHLLALSLTRRNLSAVAFTCPRRALEALTEFDILITDYEMPEMNGLEVAREAYARGWRGSLLLMSGRSSLLRRLADLPPAHLSLKKPFSPVLLFETLQNFPGFVSGGTA